MHAREDGQEDDEERRGDKAQAEGYDRGRWESGLASVLRVKELLTGLEVGDTADSAVVGLVAAVVVEVGSSRLPSAGQSRPGLEAMVACGGQW